MQTQESPCSDEGHESKPRFIDAATNRLPSASLCALLYISYTEKNKFQNT